MYVWMVLLFYPEDYRLCKPKSSTEDLLSQGSIVGRFLSDYGPVVSICVLNIRDALIDKRRLPLNLPQSGCFWVSLQALCKSFVPALLPQAPFKRSHALFPQVPCLRKEMISSFYIATGTNYSYPI